MKSDLVDVACRIIHETEKAFCITDDDERHIWLPKSQREWDCGSAAMTMPEWQPYVSVPINGTCELFTGKSNVSSKVVPI